MTALKICGFQPQPLNPTFAPANYLHRSSEAQYLNHQMEASGRKRRTASTRPPSASPKKRKLGIIHNIENEFAEILPGKTNIQVYHSVMKGAFKIFLNSERPAVTNVTMLPGRFTIHHMDDSSMMQVFVPSEEQCRSSPYHGSTRERRCEEMVKNCVQILTWCHGCLCAPLPFLEESIPFSAPTIRKVFGATPLEASMIINLAESACRYMESIYTSFFVASGGGGAGLQYNVGKVRAIAEESVSCMKAKLERLVQAVSSGNLFLAESLYLGIVLWSCMKLKVDCLNRRITLVEDVPREEMVQYISSYLRKRPAALSRQDAVNVFVTSIGAGSTDLLHCCFHGNGSKFSVRDRVALYVGKACLDAIIADRFPSISHNHKPNIGMQMVKKILCMDLEDVRYSHAALGLDILYAVSMHEGVEYIRRVTMRSPEGRVNATCDIYTAVREAYLASCSNVEFRGVDVNRIKSLHSPAVLEELSKNLARVARCGSPSDTGEVGGILGILCMAVRELWLQVLLYGDDFDKGNFVAAFSAAGYDPSILITGILPNLSFSSRHARIFREMVYSHVDYNMHVLEKEYRSPTEPA